MSDYLGNLAARTLAAPPLRPRVRMRFEPEAPVAEAVAAPEPVSPQPRIEAPREQRAVAETPPRVIERERVREVVKPGRETTRVVTIEAAAAEPPREAPSEPEVIERVETINSREVVEGSGRLVRSVPKSGRDVRSPQVKNNDNDETPRPHRYDEEPPRVIAQEPLIRERLLTRSEPEAPVAPAEPSVQVSIGRIEIRATTAPPAQRRARGRSAMSIDDYIAKRDAKERR